MSETIPSTDSQEIIKSVDWLNKENLWSKFTPEIELKLKNYLKQKYNIEWDKVINIASDELKELKKQIELSQNPVETVVKFVFGDYIETKLENEWMKAVSIENVTTWINNPRLENAKSMLNEVLWKKLDTYDFLWDRKEVIKLAMINKILKNPITLWVKWYLEWLTKTLESIAKMDLSKLWEIVSKDKSETDNKASENLWVDIEKAFLNDISPYFKWFDNIKTKLDKIIDVKQKKNIINNMSYFNNPNEIEKWFNVELTPEFIESNKDKSKVELKPEELEMLKKYMIDSRDKIENTLKMWEMWDKAKNLALTIAWMPWAIWKFWKGFIEWILKIPFLWKIFAIFLWLDPNNAIADFNEQIWSFKSLNLLKSLWIKKDNNWNIVSNWVSPFDKVDLSWIEHNEVRKELKDLIKHKPADKDEKEFIKEAFSKEGIHIIEEKDWKKTDTILKFDINPDKKTDRINVSNKDFKDIIKKWYEKFENTKKGNIDTEKIQEEKAKNQKLETEVDSKISTLDAKKTEKYDELSVLKADLDHEIAQLWKIIKWEYNKYINWDTPFYSINWIKIQDILNNSSETFEPLILRQLWSIWILNKTSKKEYIEKYKEIFDLFFSNLKEYCKDNKDTHTQDIKSMLNYHSDWFKDFLKEKKEALNKRISDKQAEIGTIYTEINWLTPSIDQ